MYKDAFDKAFGKGRDKIENSFAHSRIVGKFISVLISLFHMHAKSLLRVVYCTIYVG